MSDTFPPPRPGLAGESPGQSRAHTLAERILLSGLVVLGAQLIIRLSGYIQAKSLAYYFGASAVTDAFLFAFEGVLLLVVLRIEKLIYPALIPVFIEQKDQCGEAEAWRFFSTVFWLLALLLFALVGLALLFPEVPLRFFALLVGKRLTPGKLEIYARALQVCAPALVGLSVASLTFSLLNACKKFFWAVIGKEAYKFLLIGGIIGGGVFSCASIDQLFPNRQLEAEGWRRYGDALRAQDEASLARLQEELASAPLPPTPPNQTLADGWLETTVKEYRGEKTPETSLRTAQQVAEKVVPGTRRGGFGLRWLGAGLLAGSILGVAVHLVALGRRLRHFRFRAAVRSPAFLTMLSLMLPLVLGVVFAGLRDFFNNFGVLAPLEETGLITINSFGRKIYTMLGNLIPLALAVAMFPFMCELVDRRDEKAMGQFVNQAARMLLLFFVPLALGIAAVSQPLARLLFEGGRLSSEKALGAGLVNACYTIVLPAYALEYLFVQAYFSSRRMWSVTLIGIGCTILSIGLSYLAVRLAGITGLAAVVAVALGYTFSRYLKSILLAIYMQRRFLPSMRGAGTGSFLLKLAVIGAASAGAAYGVHRVYEKMVNVGGVAIRKETESSAGVPLLVRVTNMGTPEGATKHFRRLSPGGPREPAGLGEEAISTVLAGGGAYVAARRGPWVCEVLVGAGTRREPRTTETIGMKALFLRIAPELLLAGLAVLVVVVALCRLLRVEELGLIVRYGREKIKARRRGARFMPPSAGGLPAG